jgi:hypothetical protein
VTSPYFPFDTAWWPAIAESLAIAGQPWPQEAIFADLRWWQDQEGVGRRRRPGRPALAARWRVTDAVARRLMALESEWGRPGKTSNEHPADIQRPSSRHPASIQRASRSGDVQPELPFENIQPTSNGHPTDIQPTSSEHPTNLPTRVPTKQEPEPEPEPEQDEHARPEPEPAPVEPPASARPAKPRKAHKPTPVLPPGVAEAWAVYKATLGPGRGDVPPKGWGVAERVAEHGVETVVRVIRWVAESPHSRAAFLRDGGYTGETLFRPNKFGEYLAFSAQSPSGRGQLTLGLSAMPPASTLDDWANEDPSTNQFLRPFRSDNEVYDGE